MIKIDNYRGSNYCKAYFDLDAVRSHGTWEREIGLELAKKLPDYFVDVDETIYKIETSVPCSKSIDELKQMQKVAQEKFSEMISRLRKKLDELKLLQKLIKEEEKKKC